MKSEMSAEEDDDDDDCGLTKSERIDLGLALLELVAVPGVGLSSRHIAAWCNCSFQAIWLIEQSALKKVKERLVELGISLGDLPVMREGGGRKKAKGRVDGERVDGEWLGR